MKKTMTKAQFMRAVREESGHPCPTHLYVYLEEAGHMDPPKRDYQNHRIFEAKHVRQAVAYIKSRKTTTAA